MRRQDREITDQNDLIKMIKENNVCRLAFFDDEFPYIVPLNYGLYYNENELLLIFHGAKQGKKIDLMKKNNNVRFEIDRVGDIITGPDHCSYSINYESVIGQGKIEIASENEKEELLRYFMKQYHEQELPFREGTLQATCVMKLQIIHLTGKRKN